MKIPFTKLHGAKNDFLVSLAAEVPVTDLQELAIAICNRHTGVGADGWILLDRTEGPDYDATMRLFNSDGSEPEISGNGTRCVALLVVAAAAGGGEGAGAGAGRAAETVRVRTGAGVKQLRLISVSAKQEYQFEMNMGKVRVLEPRATVQGLDAVIVDAGNPQCAIPVEDFDFDWRAAGAAIERDARFPNRTNVSFVRAVDTHTIDVRFWERGAGETNSSGTGSSGAAVAAIARGFARSSVNVLTPAGPLKVRTEDDVYLTGPAEFVADGFYHYGRIVTG
jgi:diaminopimelate epimerase